MSEDATEEVTPIKEPVIVEMSDGTKCNFGRRANLVSSMDVPTKTLTFKISTGVIISWAVEGLEAFSTLQTKIYLYGLLEKVKSSLAGVGKPDLEVAISNNIADIKAGNFNIRSAGSSVAATGLTLVMKAFALAKSEQQEEYVHLRDLDNPSVIDEVCALWNGKSPSEKRAVRTNPFVQYHLSMLEKEANPKAGNVL